MSEKSRFDHRIRALHRRAGLLKTEGEAISEWFILDLHRLRMERSAILWAIEVRTKNEELASALEGRVRLLEMDMAALGVS
jgi:hypothetical protein